MCQPIAAEKLKNPQEALESAKESAKESTKESTKQSTNSKQLRRALAPSHTQKRDTRYNLLWCLGPSLFCWLTPVLPIYLVALARFISTHLAIGLHYLYVEKDNYFNKLSQKQLEREREHYLVAI